MKGYKKFIWVFSLLLLIYIIAEATRPKPLDWQVTLSMYDKNPFGAYCLFTELKDLWPGTPVHAYRSALYNQVNNFRKANTAYLLISPNLTDLSKEDVHELLGYAAAGNYVWLCSDNFGPLLTDTLHFKTARRMDFNAKDSITINFKYPQLRARRNWGFLQMTLDAYFKEYDTLKTTVLGENQRNDANFIKMRYGKGVIFIHLMPLCFTNYFLLTRNNATYTASALSHIPRGLSTVYWDEYYKPGISGISSNPLRYILNNEYLRWAFRLALAAMVLYVLFGIKRRQRIIPVMMPLQNTTLNFIKTVGNVYFNQHDNKNIAEKMIGYWLERIRSRYLLITYPLDARFAELLSKKTGADRAMVDELLQMVALVQGGDTVSDQVLLQLNQKLDEFYEAAG